MTPPEHILIGMTSANVVYATMHFTPKSEPKSHGYAKLVLVMALAAALPDIDSFFGNYTSTDVITGHRGWTHSFAGVFLLGLGLTLAVSALTFVFRIFTSYFRILFYHFKSKETGEPNTHKKMKDLFQPFLPKVLLILLAASFIGGVTHLLADLPTPPSVWGGLPLLWPLKSGDQYVRYGCFGSMGWYDIINVWYLIAAFLVSVPAVIIGKFFHFFKARAMKIIRISWFALLLIGTVLFFTWMGSKILKEKYENDQKWYAYQLKELEKMPEYVKDPTLKGIKLFSEIFKQSRSFNINP